MNYSFIKDIITLAENFEQEASDYTKDVKGFKEWIAENNLPKKINHKINWEGNDRGRSADSVINTLIIHMNRYAKTYSKAAIYGSEFTTQEEFIYLINLKAFGGMTKMELIKKNIQDKPTGMQIINRLITKGWINQKTSASDKRSKHINITKSGLKALEQQMDKIRQATKIVTGNLTEDEKHELIRLLEKLNGFHNLIFQKNYKPAELLDYANKTLHIN